MKYNYFPQEIQKRVKDPFAFVSYCHQNSAVYDRVQTLVSYLRSQNINIVYDEGGLEPGTELTQFENLIFDNNCKFVLVVCDKGYLEKVEKSAGGAWREYLNISNDYPKNINKYIPLIVDAEIPIFSGKVYIPFIDDSKFVNIVNRLASLKENNERSQVKVDTLVQSADLLCDNGNYSAALKKINHAIKVYGQQKRTSKAYWAKLYNLKLVICIYKQDVKNAILVADELVKMITNKMESEKRANYFGNCALAYRMRSSESNEYEECARKAYVITKKYGVEDAGYYACMYATALYETEQYTAAYRISKEALKDFTRVHNDMSVFDKNDYVMYTKIKGNIAEIAVTSSKSIRGGRKKKLDLLLEAQENILDIINIKELEDEDYVQAEIYSIAVIVFEALNEFYSSVM